MSKYIDTEYYESSEDSESDYDSEPKYREDREEEYEELTCKNLDPALAKLMGIIIEEQKESNWKPPSKSGLDNSERIISSNYFTNTNNNFDVDYFKTIKDNIINYKKLTEAQLEYIKKLNNEQKFELIQLYDRIMDFTNSK